MTLEEEVDSAEVAKLGALGLHPLLAPDPPTPISKIEVSALTNDELTKLYLQHVAYAQFVGSKVASHRSFLVSLKAVRDRKEAELRAELKTAKVPASEAKHVIDTDSDLLDLSEKIAECDATLILLEAYLNNYKAQYAALSRVVSIRQIDLDSVRLGPDSRRARGQRPRQSGLRSGSSAKSDEEALEEDEDDDA